MNNVNLTEKKQKELVEEVYADFARRQEERRLLERKWALNINFINGDQYCDVNAIGELEEDTSGYYWQERRVFNRMAPAMDARLSKLSRIRPRLAVRAASDEDDDRRAATLSSAILNAAYEDCGLDEAVTQALSWSEACGTAFYKVLWDSDGGGEVGLAAGGQSVRAGKARVVAVSPFEVYPEALTEEDLYAQPSIIHARAVPVGDIFAAYGVRLQGKDFEGLYSTDPRAGRKMGGLSGGVKHGYELVIERYSRPNEDFAEGRLTIVAGGLLLYDGALPYANGENGGRVYPFVRQRCIPVTGMFFGASVAERLVPVQRAYNAVKNRKHEFLNRIAMGVLAVEEGSVDTDELTEDGLIPGKILVYRQGGTPPSMLTLGTVPAEFTEEEERLESEFDRLSCTTDFSKQTNSFSSVTSATGLQLIIEQDDAKLNVCCDQIKAALKRVGKYILRLYKQYSNSLRLIRYAGANGEQAQIAFRGSDITGDDVILEAESDLNLTPARRRAALYEMLDRGLFSDENGKVSPAFKSQLLATLGYGGYVGARDLDELNSRRCAEENAALKRGEEIEVKPYDDNAVHIREHTAYLLSEKLTEGEEERICAHLEEHKNKIKISEVKNEG